MNVAPGILKDKPLLFLNLEKFQSIKRQRYDDWEWYIEEFFKFFETHNEFMKLQFLWRTVSYFEKLPKTEFTNMLRYIADQHERRKIPAGDMVGVVAAQSISERFTQTTLNSFHIAGTKKAAAQMGIKRIVELFDALKTIQQPIIENVHTKFPKNRIIHRTLRSMSSEYGIQYRPKEGTKLSSFEVFFKMKDENELKLLEISSVDLPLHDIDDDVVRFVFPESFNLSKIKYHFQKLIDKYVFGAHGGVELDSHGVLYLKDDMKQLELDQLISSLPDLDLARIIPNDIHFIYRTLGIEAVRSYLLREIPSVLSKEGIEIDIRHVMLLVDNMTYMGFIKPNKYSGIKMNESVILKATFEQATKTFAKAAALNMSDDLSNVSSQILVGKISNFGSNLFEDVGEIVEYECDDAPEEEITFEPAFVPPPSPCYLPVPYTEPEVIQPTFFD